MLEFDQIYDKYFSSVFKYVLSICRDEMIAEEVTQETFFKAIKGIDRFNGSCTIYVWLCQIAKNTYFKLHRHQKRYALSEDVGLQSEIDIETDFMDKDTTRRLHILLHNLKEPYKEVFTLRVFGELSFTQIADLFGKTDVWARQIFYRAKTKLQEGMK